MRIAIITPWPQERSGIADYSYDLTKGLTALGCDIEVFTTCKSPLKLGNMPIHNSSPSDWDLSNFDVRVFHFGNNLEFHQHMLKLLQRFGGVVHLHDFVIHHLMAGLAQVENGWEWYFEHLSLYYGEEFSLSVKNDWESGVYVWEGDSVLNVPMNDEVVETAQAIITHSKFAKIKIQEKKHFKPIAHIEQVYDMPEVPSQTSENFVFGVFGHVQPNKCIEQLLDALTLVSPRKEKFEVRIVGKIADEAYYGLLKSKLRQINEYVELTVLGYVEDDQFLIELNSADMIIALRNPTMGETSAIAMRSLQLGTPLIVNDIGWYSELPDFVHKVAVGSDGVPKLAEIIQKFVDDRSLLKDIGTESLAYAESNLGFNKVCQQYLDVLFNIAHMEDNKADTFERNLATKLYELGLIKESEHKPHRTFIYEKLTPFFNGD